MSDDKIAVLRGENMEEWIKKSDVLELLCLPSDILNEYIYELKGVWVDDDWLNDKWIPCSKKLPDANDNKINDSSISIPVLVQYKDVTAEPEVLHYNTFTKKFCYDQMDLTDNVIAWMLLPEPYRG